MHHKRNVERTCFACRQTMLKGDMLRLVADEGGLLWPDMLQKYPGRGSYLCMQANCLARMNDRRLGVLYHPCHISLPQWLGLEKRLNSVLEKAIIEQLIRLKPMACVGRDAVMHQMWKSTPLLLMMVNESGQALQRQVMNAVAKRNEMRLKTIPLDHVSEDWLIQVFQRDKVSVVTLPVSRQTEKLQQWSIWHRHLKGRKVSD
ncbi:MAG: YlxR family protein, partial [Mariprofundaceae bacterium]|nr:YlxR family protein [Mariprofundaceae bacterium]